VSERNEVRNNAGLTASVLKRAAPASARLEPPWPYRGEPVALDNSAESRDLSSPLGSAERLVEELRIIKRRLLGIKRTDLKARSNIFMVASALPGDGKSFIAFNLAKSLSTDQDHEVILIDGDFKKPHLSRSFGLLDVPGILDVVDGAADLMSVAHPVADSRLVFIPAGTGSDRANERLASKATQALFDEQFSKETGRIVVFDSAPVLRASESQVLAQLVGQVVLVVRAGRTPKKALSQALEVLGGTENCSLVLNDADVVPLSRYSSRSYGYGYGYGYGK
jgi:protein-tyrosine kinase